MENVAPHTISTLSLLITEKGDACKIANLSVSHGKEASSLAAIRNQAVEMAIWERALPSALDDWLDALDPDHLPDGRLLLESGTVAHGIKHLFEVASTPPDEMCTLLQKDIVSLARLFMTVMQRDIVDIRLETIKTDACWKFHRDCVPARLLCSYRGPGTEWVPPKESSSAIRMQKNYTGQIHRFPRYHVGLFKGSCAAPASGIVHRSPPIAKRNQVRLLLCLNLPSASSPPLWRAKAYSLRK